MAELARVLRPGGLLALTFPYRREHADEHVEHDLYGTPLHRHPDLLPAPLLGEQRRSSACSAQGAFTVLERGLWRKAAVREAQGALHRVVPANLELGRFLGPALGVLGARALTDAPADQPGPGDNVFRLLLRRELGREDADCGVERAVGQLAQGLRAERRGHVGED